MRKLIVLTALVGLSVLSVAAQATLIVAPNGLAAAEGNLNNCIPFTGCNTSEYQQVYDASAFSALTGPAMLTQIAFRPDRDYGAAFSYTYANVLLSLSTTATGPDGLSTIPSANVGADNTVVYSGTLTLSSAFTGPVGGPKDFDVVINLMTPFLYDPTLGNLLIDYTQLSGESYDAVFLDAHDAFGDQISRFHGGYTDTWGLVTQFTFAGQQSVPAPAVPALLAFGLLGFLLRRR